MSTNPSELMTIFLKSGALLEGHFKLSSGLHSDKYMQCAQVLQYPEHARLLGKLLADHFRDREIGAVISPALGGVIIGHEVAAALNVRAIFGERKDGRMLLRRGFRIGNNERMLIIEDVITTGKSTGEIIELVRENGGIVAGIGALANRSEKPLELPCPASALLTPQIHNWEPEKCPLCSSGVPLTAPGSRFAG